ncbi:hypothetical protein GYH30_038986 [Glycine max]|uniref:AP complex mu/sigma subunit domain-containing protein n=2 Tax=Glycine subgen. Soja TaxID=1462606 RepID=A0A0R0GI71_SOYBN|nr:hypothetical protein GYH30_038986 [Glycine max]RZB67385.1 AP-1 complex subunit sigma-1 [Glycine soja]
MLHYIVYTTYFILDDILLDGAMQETSKRTTLRLMINAQEDSVETAKEEASSLSNIIAQATK